MRKPTGDALVNEVMRTFKKEHALRRKSGYPTLAPHEYGDGYRDCRPDRDPGYEHILNGKLAKLPALAEDDADEQPE